MSKEYEITNFNQLANLVNAENLENLSKDLINWLNTVVWAKENQDVLSFKPVFIWRNDGNHESFLKIVEKDGEVVYLERKDNE